MGLVQAAVERAGIATITLSTLWAFTVSVGAPRVAAIEYPMGRPFGNPGDVTGQRDILMRCLDAIYRADEPGWVCHLPHRWPQKRAQTRAESHPQVSPPIVKLLKRKPWLLSNLMRGVIPDNQTT